MSEKSATDVPSSKRAEASWRLPREWLCGGLANALTSGLLNPLDVAKTRLQAERKNPNSTLRSVIKQLYREGGVIGLWRPGLVASFTREMLSSGSRAGLYAPVRDALDKSVGHGQKDLLLCKVLAALTTGTVGSIISNPIDLVKIRLMADPSRYSSLFHALKVVLQTEGYQGLTKGIVPSTLRGASIAVGKTKKDKPRNEKQKECVQLHIVTFLSCCYYRFETAK